MDKLIYLISDKLKYTGIELLNPHHACIPAGITAVIGPNGSGKTSLAKVLESGWNFMTNSIKAHDGRRLNIKRVEFSDIHSLSAYKGEYYQQRFEATTNDEIPTVGDLLGDRLNTTEWHDASQMLGIAHFTHKRLNFLSSGELRKLLIANIMFEKPDLLILDNPYIGLDAPSRQVLDDALVSMREKGISILLLISSPYDISEAVSWVIEIQNMTISLPTQRPQDMSLADFRLSFSHLFDFGTANCPPAAISAASTCDAQTIVELRHCRVKYGQNTIISDVSWTIRRGECWALSGPNGAGKSTLLSLINADNPQGYSNEIYLFGRRRGTGESIWDIKRRIGYISPERHLYFNAFNDTAFDVVAGGLKEAVEKFRALSPEELEIVDQWLKILKIDHLAKRRFATLSFGEQRLALLGRTLIKNPDLLILDEPLHGLDVAHKQRVNSLIENMVIHKHSTLIYVSHYETEIPGCVTHRMELHKA